MPVALYQYYQQNRSKGLCGCGREPVIGRAQCKECRDVADARKSQRLRAGRCPCGARPVQQGKKRCVECYEYHRRIRAERKAAGICSRCGANPLANKNFCAACASDHNRKTHVRQKALRLRALNAYGGVCKCCGESRKEFLCIDHVNDDGAQHRKTFTGTIFAWLKKHNYPEGFQVLCCNCNSAKQWYGVCPHEWPTRMMELTQCRDQDN